MVQDFLFAGVRLVKDVFLAVLPVVGYNEYGHLPVMDAFK